MQLESTYDLAFIDEELSALRDFFEILGDSINEKVANAEVRESATAICTHHQRLVEQDMDSIVEMLTDYFYRPLKTFLPEKLRLGAVIWTQIGDMETKALKLYVSLTVQSEINIFIKHLAVNPDSRVSVFGDKVFGYWLIVIRKEKPNISERKLLK